MATTDIAFHFNAPHKLVYACKLLRKAHAAGARVAVLAPEASLAHLDKALWTFSALDFVAHVRAPCTTQVLERTPVVLCDNLDTLEVGHHFTVLLNLTDTVPGSFDSFKRVIEVVTLDDGDRQLARNRWKRYTELGNDITRHDLKLAA